MSKYPQLGSVVRFSARFSRVRGHGNGNGSDRLWFVVRLPEPIVGIYAGVRTLSDGVFDYSQYHFERTESHTAAIVYTHTSKAPMYVPMVYTEVVYAPPTLDHFGGDVLVNHAVSAAHSLGLCMDAMDDIHSLPDTDPSNINIIDLFSLCMSFIQTCLVINLRKSALVMRRAFSQSSDRYVHISSSTRSTIPDKFFNNEVYEALSESYNGPQSYREPYTNPPNFTELSWGVRISSNDVGDADDSGDVDDAAGSNDEHTGSNS